MPKGLRGESCPADVIGCVVVRIATGELGEMVHSPSGRMRNGQAGGKARAEAVSEVRRYEIARAVAAGMWR